MNGKWYMGIKGNQDSIYGKKEATGIILVKTKRTIVIGYYNEKQMPGNAAVTVASVANYLIRIKY